MRKYYKDVDMRSRKAMVDFLVGHFRYYTMNSWNLNTSYANNVKIYNLHLPHDVEDKFYDALSTEEFDDVIYERCSEFCYDHDGRWQIARNGRSGGYLVLYSGNKKPLEYKSYCTECGQRNYKTVEESGNCKCGACGADARRNYTRTVYQYYTSTASVDSACEEDFADWTMTELRERVRLVQEFDKFCDDLLAELVELVGESEVVTETIMVPKEVKVLKKKGA